MSALQYIMLALCIYCMKRVRSRTKLLYASDSEVEEYIDTEIDHYFDHWIKYRDGCERIAFTMSLRHLGYNITINLVLAYGSEPVQVTITCPARLEYYAQKFLDFWICEAICRNKHKQSHRDVQVTIIHSELMDRLGSLVSH